MLPKVVSVGESVDGTCLVSFDRGLPIDGATTTPTRKEHIRMEPMTGYEAERAYIRGELTIEEVIAGLDDGTIVLEPLPPPPDPSSPTWYWDVEAARNTPLFEPWVMAKEREKLPLVRAAKWRALAGADEDYEETESSPYEVDVRADPDWPGNQ